MSEEQKFTDFGPNSGYVEELYKLFLVDPSLVGEDWGNYFASLNGQAVSYRNGTITNGTGSNAQHASTVHLGSTNSSAALALQERVSRTISSYRKLGHLAARINPLTQGVNIPSSPASLTANFSDAELSAEVRTDGFAGQETIRLAELISKLKNTYCGSVGFDVEHLESEQELAWLRSKIESYSGSTSSDKERCKRRLQMLVNAEALESELHKRYVGQKRFSLEGGEGLIAALATTLDAGQDAGVKEAVIGMAHRGRLSVLVNILGKPLKELFLEFEDNSTWTVVGSGDVKYHMGFESDFRGPTSAVTRVRLAPNPSHLEAVNPVVEGMARVLQDQKYAGERKPVLPILVHGDAAFPGQGVVSETFNFSNVSGYTTGGTVHFVVNNQIGFTAVPDESRSSTYCTDIVKGMGIPVFHVNGEDVDALCWVSELALEYRNTFGKDSIVDIYCFRKYGHNEGDDPSFTQPLMYSEIKTKTPVAKVYGQQLIERGLITQNDLDGLYAEFRLRFDVAQAAAKAATLGEACAVHGRVKGRSPDTGVALAELEKIAQTLIEYPSGFVPHPKLQKILEKRVETLTRGEGIDWGFAESLAFGSLVSSGFRVRVSGQDSGRGTFSQRQLELHDYEKEAVYYPLNNLPFGKFEVFNSVLSEESVLAFEFGFGSLSERALVCWEGQFGDFANGAQVVVDQFISSSEQKWSQRSGITMLLPHGYEGQGPEHSSARLERYLQLCADGNMSVCYPTTAAQHFHLLRRQALNEIKRPLIVMTPKSLLRSADAACKASDLTAGKFEPIIHSQSTGKGKQDALFIVSGKVYYDLKSALDKAGVAANILRIEELYPFPMENFRKILAAEKPKRIAWVQEEPKNMGAYSYVLQALHELEISFSYIGREPSASTATGSGKHHAKELADFLAKAVDFAR